MSGPEKEHRPAGEPGDANKAGRPEASLAPLGLLTEAVRYAAAGWPVFPVRPGGKEPLTLHGFKDASTDLAQVVAWWSRHPDANIGHPTGLRHDVLDVDRRPGKIDAVADVLPRLRRAGLLSGCVGIAETRNAGFHLWYPASGLPSSSLPGHGLDFKGAGGYVLLPPSWVASDYPGLPGAYTWHDADWARAGTPLAWDRIAALLAPPRPAQPRRHLTVSCNPTLEPLLQVVRNAREGNRNHALFWATARASADGIADPAELLAAAREAGLPEREALATIRSGIRTGKAGAA